MMKDNFLHDLLNYDTENIDEKILTKIRTTFVPDPEYVPARVS